MSSYGADRGYKVVYPSRSHAPDPIDDEPHRRRPRRDYDRDYDRAYDRDYDKSYHREYRDERMSGDRDVRYGDQHRGYPPPAPLPPAPSTTKTTYEVGRDRNSEAYVKRSNALIIGSDNSRSDFEVLRPQRRDDGAYVVDLARSRVYHDDRDHHHDSRARYYDAPPPSRARRTEDVVMYDSSRSVARDRALSHADYRDVQVMEDIDDDPRRPRRGREPEIVPEAITAPPPRLRSSMRGRNDSPPDEWEVRRSHSVGFFKDQISHHDASESRHERPGAEAHVAGRYLHHAHDYDDNDDYYTEQPRRSHRARSRSQGGHGPRRSDPRLRDPDYDDDRGLYTEETMRQYEYEEDLRAPYAPQQDPGDRRRRHSHHRRRRDDDERSAYSEYETKTKKTKEYYR